MKLFFKYILSVRWYRISQLVKWNLEWTINVNIRLKNVENDNMDGRHRSFWHFTRRMKVSRFEIPHFFILKTIIAFSVASIIAASNFVAYTHQERPLQEHGTLKMQWSTIRNTSRKQLNTTLLLKGHWCLENEYHA